MQTIPILDLRELCNCSNIRINVSIWEPTVFDAWKQNAAKPFHRKCPIRPNRATGFNTICDVKKCVNCNRAGRQAICRVLVVKSIELSKRLL